jgi:hypothetical protein
MGNLDQICEIRGSQGDVTEGSYLPEHCATPVGKYS